MWKKNYNRYKKDIKYKNYYELVKIYEYGMQ